MNKLIIILTLSFLAIKAEDKPKEKITISNDQVISLLKARADFAEAQVKYLTTQKALQDSFDDIQKTCGAVPIINTKGVPMCPDKIIEEKK